MSSVTRFAIFVDGSNQFGSLKHLNLQVDNYEMFYRHVLQCALEVWRHSLIPNAAPIAQLRRVYWYEVGAIDEWDLDSSKTQNYIKVQFNSPSSKLVKSGYLAKVGKASGGQTGSALSELAWNEFFTDIKTWYEGKKETLSGMKRFHYGVMSSTDFIDIRAVAHWKVDFANKSLAEKGLDTALAVDMVALRDNYDVALVISGDADNLPGVQYVQQENKMVGVVEFIKGSPPESKGKASSNRLKVKADFVVQVFETDLLKDKVASRPTASK
jgi:uncharacterized LabA/DUF88 family protein